jgi:hypothetical protein
MRKFHLKCRWDQVINKDIESFYRKALANYKYRISELKELMEEDELLKNLFVNLKNEYRISDTIQC